MLHEWTFENFGKHHRARETERKTVKVTERERDREGKLTGHAKETDAHDDDPRQCECAAQCARSSGVVSLDEAEAVGGKECGRFRWLGCLVKSCLFVILAKNFIHDGSNTQNFVY